MSRMVSPMVTGFGVEDAVTRVGHFCVILTAFCALWAARRRERRILGQLDDRLLRDIGMSRRTAAREASLPFWRGGGDRPGFRKI